MGSALEFTEFLKQLLEVLLGNAAPCVFNLYLYSVFGHYVRSYYFNKSILSEFQSVLDQVCQHLLHSS